MRQRVMIAIGLACNPKLIIADEPTTALDVTIQAQILELMKDLSRQLDIALVVITHNLGIVARYADRVNVMYAARIIEQGTADDVFCGPAIPTRSACCARCRGSTCRAAQGSRPSRACRRTCSRRPPAAASRRVVPHRIAICDQDPALARDREPATAPPAGAPARSRPARWLRRRRRRSLNDPSLARGRRRQQLAAEPLLDVAGLTSTSRSRRRGLLCIEDARP